MSARLDPLTRGVDRSRSGLDPLAREDTRSLDATGVREGVSVSNRNRKYSPEFRAEAVRLYRSVKGEKSMRELAEELGVSNEPCAAGSSRQTVNDDKGGDN